MTSQQPIITLTINQLQSIVEQAAQTGAKKALEEHERLKRSAQLLKKEYLTFKEVGVIFGVSRVTVNRWEQQGKITKKYISGLPRFESKEIQTLLN